MKFLTLITCILILLNKDSRANSCNSLFNSFSSFTTENGLLINREKLNIKSYDKKVEYHVENDLGLTPKSVLILIEPEDSHLAIWHNNIIIHSIGIPLKNMTRKAFQSEYIPAGLVIKVNNIPDNITELFFKIMSKFDNTVATNESCVIAVCEFLIKLNLSENLGLNNTIYTLPNDFLTVLIDKAIQDSNIRNNFEFYELGYNISEIIDLLNQAKKTHLSLINRYLKLKSDDKLVYPYSQNNKLQNTPSITEEVLEDDEIEMNLDLGFSIFELIHPK